MGEIGPGDHAPWFVGATADDPALALHALAGRHVVLTFFGTAADPALARLWAAIGARPDLFDGDHATMLAIGIAPADRRANRVADRAPSLRVVWDLDRQISRLYGVLDEVAPARVRLRPRSFVLDPNLRVLAVVALGDPGAHAATLVDYVSRLPRRAAGGLAPPSAPVLTVPAVFDRELCRALIAHHQADGGYDSGTMHDGPDGRTVRVVNHAVKRRRDVDIADAALRDRIRDAIVGRLVPELRKAFAFEATRIERYMVACYDAGEAGFFAPHRDNLTAATAHRRFAVTLNLNAEEYEGGDLRFPEYDARAFRAPTGGAVVFSCALLHEVLPVTRGRRYACLPFLHDEAAAAVRERNRDRLAEGTITV